MNLRSLWNAILATRPSDDDKIRQLDQMLPVFPGLQFIECVGADQKKELVFERYLLSNAPDRVDGVAGFRTFLQARRLKSRVRSARDLHHPEAVLVWTDATVLMRRISGRDEDYAIEVKLSKRFLGDRKMGEVDRVECSSEEAEARPHSSVLNCLWTRVARDLLFRCLAGELVTAVIILVRRVTLGPFPLRLVRVYQTVEQDPEILIVYGLFIGFLPTVTLPTVNPLCYAILDVFGIGDDFDGAAFLQTLESFDSCRQFHTVVSGVRARAEHFAPIVAIAKNARPSSLAWIALAGAVSYELDMLQTVAAGSSSASSSAESVN